MVSGFAKKPSATTDSSKNTSSKDALGADADANNLKQSFSSLQGQDNKTRLNDFDDNIRVSEFLTYRNNEIKVVCKFVTLLELFTEQVIIKAKELEEQW